MSTKKRSLGRGLDALLDDNTSEESGVTTLRISQIEPNRAQPRKDFDQQQLQELSDSIREHGVLQPLLVCEKDGGYIIVAGERRWRAARMAGLTEVPVLVRDYDDQTVAEVSLIENLQRADLNPIEEAAGYRNLIEEFGFTQESAAQRVGKSRSSVANSLRLLTLPDPVQVLLREGRLSAGHAKVLGGISDIERCVELAKESADGKMSVRDLEKAAVAVEKPKKQVIPKTRESFYDEFEIAVKGEMGRKVRVAKAPAGDKPGCIEIEFFSKEDLLDLAMVLTGEKRAQNKNSENDE
ncbi:MAG TPA: ParB/RepB/Spo0J family partition protein [Oscillospiraceae bacterium]|nr:ParB/RepB/Spo0J family partition protein [Oscillospiraceae bacterium]HPF57102.1 ParB/RepB/Spo0J family partition protein [Clostridiales bacterium]HPK34835.1 ParB/RepB/Spo0J family partition protein [Oscillospiraceae bacterium]HPR76850.1 ParB/RepB/Spo0J family partition protein [Oscillospiraceae bacterium]